MSLRPDIRDFNEDIMHSAYHNSSNKWLGWINNTTRLNETNMNKERQSIVNFLKEALKLAYSQLEADMKSVVQKNAGWIQLGTANEALGEIFNDYDNNSVATNKRYQATFGRYTQANGNGQFVCGNANAEVEDALFIVGCGSFNYVETTDTSPQTGITYYTLANDVYIEFKGTTFTDGTKYYVFNVERQNALVINADGTVNILKDVTFDGNETFNGTVTFNESITLEKGFTANADSNINGNLTVTKAPKNKTHVVRKKELDDLRNEISGALHYRGVVELAPDAGSTSVTLIYVDENGNKGYKNISTSGKTADNKLNSGDVVLLGEFRDVDNNGEPIELEIITEGKEYIFNGSTWSIYDTQANYVLTKDYDIDKDKLNKALFSNGIVPDWNDDNSDDNTKSLQTQLEKKIEDEATKRENVDKELTNNISSINTALDNLEDKDNELTDAINILATEELVENDPKFAVTWKNEGKPLNDSYEAGTVINIAYDVKFTDGDYKYPNPKDGSTKMGCTTKSYLAEFNGQTLKASTGMFNGVTVTPDTNLTAKITATYNDADNTPVNKLGLEDSRYTHKSASEIFEKTLKGYMQGCFYGTISKSNYTINSDLIRPNPSDSTSKMKASNKACKSGDKFSFDIPVGTTAIIVACPEGENGLKNVYNTKLYIDVTNTFTKENYSISVKNAGGADYDTRYNIWIYKPAEPYIQAQSMEITLG